jgi:hypothetical protein
VLSFKWLMARLMAQVKKWSTKLVFMPSCGYEVKNEENRSVGI